VTDQMDALVIFGATGDLAKLETFPALVGLVQRGVLKVPVVGVAKSGWGLDQFRQYAEDSLRLNKMDPASDAARQMLGMLRYVDGDLDDPATYEAMAQAMGDAQRALYYLEVPPSLFGRIAQGIAGAGRAANARVMVEKPFGTDLKSARQLNETMHQYFTGHPRRRSEPHASGPGDGAGRPPGRHRPRRMAGCEVAARQGAGAAHA
jgi:glucose-6-phosphate 1-dehydrogenase